jgi:hypothetical protein
MNRYISIWDRLADAVRCGMAAGHTEAEAQSDLCHAICDRAVKLRVHLGKSATTPMTSRGTVVDGEDVEIPPQLSAGDIDWNNSRPLKPWPLRRERMPRLTRAGCCWHIERMEVSRNDVTRLFGGAQGAHEQAMRKGTQRVRGGSSPGREPTADYESARRRGAKPKKFERVREAMMSDIQQGRRSGAELGDMLEKELSASYGVSRDTARRARNAVLSALQGLNSRQISTNDK